MPPKVLHTEIEIVMKYRKRGISIRDISKMTGIPKSVVHRIIHKDRACDKNE